MKKLSFFLAMLLTFGVGNAWADEYELYSGTITEGDYLIVYDNGAMNTTVASDRLGYTGVTPSGNIIKDPAEAIVWHIAPSGNYWTIYNAKVKKYAASTGAKNKAQLLASGTDNKSLWTVTGTEKYEFVNKQNATNGVNKNLRRNTTYGFACYSTSTGGALSLYKKVDNVGANTPKPVIPGSQEFETETFTIEITAEEGATIYYTLDGSDPTEESTQYTEAITITNTTTIKAIAVKEGVASSVASATYTKVNIITGKTCAEAAALCNTTESTDKYQVEGYVTSIETVYNADFNNITFWMADTKDGGNVLQGYRVKPTNNADKAVKVGDRVQVIGKLKKYNSTCEFNTGVYTITEVAPIYNVTIISEHGTVTATPMSGIEGTEVTLTVETASGWVFDSWTVKDASDNDVMVTENKFKIPASHVTVTANYTASVAPDAVLNLSANGVVTTNTYKVGETVDLPETITNDCSKVFVGWSADANCATEPEYAPGAEFALTAEEHTLYAVYAIETNLADEEEYTFTSFNQANTVTIDAPESFTITLLKNAGSTAPQWNANSSQARVYAKGSLVISANDPITKIVYTYTVNENSKGVKPTIDGVAGTTNAGDWDSSTKIWTGNDKTVTFSTSGTAGNVGFTKVAVTVGGVTYSNYSTTCSTAPVAEVSSAKVSATAAGTEGKITVAYENVDIENVVVAIFNNNTCTEAFTSDWLQVTLDGDKNITYTVAENTTYAERNAFIQLTAPEANGVTEPAKVVIPVTQAGKDKVFASLEALLAAITPTTEGVEVTVTLTDEVIIDFYKSGSYTNGIKLNVPYQDGTKEIEIYCKDVPTTWAVGGKVSGTLTCPWKLYYDTWELCPATWTELTYTAPVSTALDKVEVSASAVKVIENGQLIVIKNGVKYNAQGQVIK